MRASYRSCRQKAVKYLDDWGSLHGQSRQLLRTNSLCLALIDGNFKGKNSDNLYNVVSLDLTLICSCNTYGT